MLPILKLVGWKKLMKVVNLDEPASFLDHVYLGCTQRECKPNETVIEQYTRMFESRIFAGATDKYLCGKSLTQKQLHGPMIWKDTPQNVWKSTTNLRTRKLSNYTKFQVLAWMITYSRKRNLNQLENYLKYAHELHSNA